MNKRKLTKKIQAIIDKNNKHLTSSFHYKISNKKQKKQLRAQQNTIPLIKWTEKDDGK